MLMRPFKYKVRMYVQTKSRTLKKYNILYLNSFVLLKENYSIILVINEFVIHTNDLQNKQVEVDLQMGFSNSRVHTAWAEARL